MIERKSATPSGRAQPPGQQREPVIESVQRALELLRVLQGGETLSVTAASELLDVSPATAYRLLVTLREQGFASQLADRSYRASPTGSQEKSSRISRTELDAIVQPIIDDLAIDVDETVLVWTRSGPYLEMLQAADGHRPGAVPHERFSRMPAYVTAAGRVLLSEVTNREVESIHSAGLMPWREAKITSLVALKRRLSVVRKTGYETTFEEAAQGTAGLAVAVHDSWRRPIVAFAVAAPLRRVHKSELQSLYELVAEAAARCEDQLRALSA